VSDCLTPNEQYEELRLKWPSEVLSFSVRRLLSITVHVNIYFFFLETAKPNALINYFTLSSFGTIL
jgi:hypothetical protein